MCERTGKATQAVTVVERGREETEGGREGYTSLFGSGAEARCSVLQ